MSDLLIGIGSLAIGIVLIIIGMKGMIREAMKTKGHSRVRWLFEEWIIPLMLIGVVVWVIVRVSQMN